VNFAFGTKCLLGICPSLNISSHLSKWALNSRSRSSTNPEPVNFSLNAHTVFSSVSPVSSPRKSLKPDLSNIWYSTCLSTSPYYRCRIIILNISTTSKSPTTTLFFFDPFSSFPSNMSLNISKSITLTIFYSGFPVSDRFFFVFSVSKSVSFPVDL